MKIEDHIYEQVCERGPHSPVTPDLVRYELPSIETFREVTPDFISTEDLEWIYLRHVGKGREYSPEWRLRLMYYLNNMVKLRTDPAFIESEAVVCHMSNGTLKMGRWDVVRELEHLVRPDGDTTDFVQWYESKPQFFRTAHDGRKVISKDKGGYYPTHFDNGIRFPDKNIAYRYTRQKFQRRFINIVGRAL